MSEGWRKSIRPRRDAEITAASLATPDGRSSIDTRPSARRVVPIILAAGASTRMGTPKALCDFDGRSCLQLALDACREAGLARPIVVLGFWAAEISAHVRLDAATGSAHLHSIPRPPARPPGALRRDAAWNLPRTRRRGARARRRRRARGRDRLRRARHAVRIDGHGHTGGLRALHDGVSPADDASARARPETAGRRVG